MKRVQLFEFEDQKWFPNSLRNYGTDFLRFISHKTKMYGPIVPVLEKGLRKSNTTQIIDVGSGSGGGLLWINEQLKKTFPELKLVLTDIYPNLPAYKTAQKEANNISYIKDPIDARNVPVDLDGLRTHFLSFHHFNPKDAQLILQNVINANHSIALFEGQERSVSSVLAMVFSPLTVLFVTPFIRPLSLGRILFTYIIPLVPLFIFWDGMVSALRTYSVEEMKELVGSLNGSENYYWEINKVKSGPSVILYLLGTKRV